MREVIARRIEKLRAEIARKERELRALKKQSVEEGPGVA